MKENGGKWVTCNRSSCPENYKKICRCVEQTCFCPGIACLFYEGSGTGKTETVYQMARQTVRDIMDVDVP